MRVEEMEKVVQECEANIINYNKQLDSHTKERDRLQKEVNDYIRSNPIAEERCKVERERDWKKKKGKNCVVWFFVFVVAVFLILLIAKNSLAAAFGDKMLYIQIAAYALPAILVIFAITNYGTAGKLQKQIDEISSKLKEFDVKLRPMEHELSEENNWVSRYKTDIRSEQSKMDEYKEMIRVEKKYAQYSVNYALVFVGEKDSYSKKYKSVRNKIEIDGIDYGYSEFPFKPIYLNPGIHTIKITVQDYFGESYHLYSSNVSQFEVSRGSIYFECEYVGATGVRVTPHESAKAFFDSTKLDQK